MYRQTVTQKNKERRDTARKIDTDRQIDKEREIQIAR
jgi:hypothetical protein